MKKLGKHGIICGKTLSEETRKSWPTTAANDGGVKVIKMRLRIKCARWQFYSDWDRGDTGTIGQQSKHFSSWNWGVELEASWLNVEVQASRNYFQSL